MRVLFTRNRKNLNIVGQVTNTGRLALRVDFDSLFFWLYVNVNVYMHVWACIMFYTERRFSRENSCTTVCIPTTTVVNKSSKEVVNLKIYAHK